MPTPPPASSLAGSIFSELLPDLSASLSNLIVRRFAAGEVLIEVGTPGDEAFLLIEGEVDVVGRRFDEGSALWARLQAGALFGEMALLGPAGALRSASVVGASSGCVLVISRAQFNAAMARDPALGDLLSNEQTRQATLATLYRSPLYPLFASFGPDALEGARSFAAGEALMTEGEPGDGLYLILSGTAAVYKRLDALEIRLASLTRGACAGELALLSGAPRNATVRAESPVRALFVEKDRFLAVYAESEPFRELIHTLRRFYQLPDKGLIAQHLGVVEGAVALQTSYALSGGRHVDCHSVPSRRLHLIRDRAAGLPGTTWTWAGPAGERVELEVDARGTPLSARVEGDFADLQLLYRCFFDAVPLPATVGTDLARSGRLRLGARQLSRLDDGVVCNCLEVTEAQIRRVVRTYAASAEKLEEMLGCGSVCGGCRPELEDLARG